MLTAIAAPPSFPGRHRGRRALNETISPVPRLSSGVLGFPDFRGFTRSLILWNLGSYFGLLILGVVTRPLAGEIGGFLALDPDLVVHHGWIWQLLTYFIIHPGAAILGTAFELLSLWFLGSLLENGHGSRWLAELFFVSVFGAGLAAVALFLAMPGSGVVLYGCFGGIFGMLIAIGVLYADTPFMMFPFPISIKAKYLVAVYMLIALATLFSAQKGFAFAQLGGALFGFLYVKFSPRRGFALASTETAYGLRNRYYRWKRRRAAKKFEVYMRKHRDN
jgi:membrane associated rhomboid family serine protease